MNKFEELMHKVGVTDLITNHSMTTDELISCLGCRVCTSEEEASEIGADIGEIVDGSENPTGIFYEEIEYLDESTEEANGCVLEAEGAESAPEAVMEPEL